MVVGIVALHLYIPGAHSLKERRRALRSLKDRLRTQYNVSVAEVDDQERWQTADLGICAVGSDRAYVEGLLDKVIGLAKADRHVEVMSSRKEFV